MNTSNHVDVLPHGELWSATVQEEAGTIENEKTVKISTDIVPNLLDKTYVSVEMGTRKKYGNFCQIISLSFDTAQFLLGGQETLNAPHKDQMTTICRCIYKTG